MAIIAEVPWEGLGSCLAAPDINRPSALFGIHRSNYQSSALFPVVVMLLVLACGAWIRASCLVLDDYACWQSIQGL